VRIIRPAFGPCSRGYIAPSTARGSSLTHHEAVNLTTDVEKAGTSAKTTNQQNDVLVESKMEIPNVYGPPLGRYTTKIRPPHWRDVFTNGSAPTARPQSPELDMTSAANFAQSKSLFSRTSNNACQTSNSSIKLDVSFDPSLSNSKKPTKRKADDISDVLDEEMRAWGSSSPEKSSTQPQSLEMTAAQMSANDAESPSSANIASPFTGLRAPSTLLEQRPTKKLKRFAEAVGYAALGGVAVGAGLFSILVATAPDFA